MSESLKYTLYQLTASPNSLTFVQFEMIIKHLCTSGRYTPLLIYTPDIYFLQYRVPYREYGCTYMVVLVRYLT
jgi:hypothetical protein